MTPSIVSYVEFRLLIQKAASATPTNTHSRVVSFLRFAFQKSKERVNEICPTVIGGNTSVAEVTLLRRFR